MTKDELLAAKRELHREAQQFVKNRMNDLDERVLISAVFDMTVTAPVVPSRFKHPDVELHKQVQDLLAVVNQISDNHYDSYVVDIDYGYLADYLIGRELYEADKDEDRSSFAQGFDVGTSKAFTEHITRLLMDAGFYGARSYP